MGKSNRDIYNQSCIDELYFENEKKIERKRNRFSSPFSFVTSKGWFGDVMRSALAGFSFKSKLTGEGDIKSRTGFV